VVHFYNNVKSRANAKGFKVTKKQIEDLAQELGCELHEATSQQVIEAVNLLGERQSSLTLPTELQQQQAVINVKSQSITSELDSNETGDETEKVSILVNTELKNQGLSLTDTQKNKIISLSEGVINTKTTDLKDDAELVRDVIIQYLQQQGQMTRQLMTNIAKDISNAQQSLSDSIDSDIENMLLSTLANQHELQGTVKKKLQLIQGVFS
jgi:hypothetical protein